MSEAIESHMEPVAQTTSRPVEKPSIEDALERKPFFEAALPVFACGAGLFSDGYINNVRTTTLYPCCIGFGSHVQLRPNTSRFSRSSVPLAPP